jgi:hypothetical protein
MLLLYLIGQASACRDLPDATLGEQPAVQAYLVVHVEPLARESDESCEDPELSECGLPVAYSWERRTENLSWLLQTWSDAGRSMDLQIGPEAALSWMGDPALEEALIASFGNDGDRNGLLLDEGEAAERVSALRLTAQGALESAVSAQSAELGVHIHTVLQDGTGQWGTAPKGRQADTVGPCESWSGEPLAEGESSIVERVLAYGVESAAPIAELASTELLSFTGHLPRTMAGKIAVVEDPDSLDPDNDVEFSSLFKPVNLGSAYSECLHRVSDHPPLEPWPADESSSLARGDGPVVVPGERVIGAMTEHLDARADTAASAAARRLIQLLLNWRYEGLKGDTDRPWVFTFHTHLYQLNPGVPGALDGTAREATTREGGMLRGDLEALAGLLDQGREWREFGGVEGSGGSVIDWIQPSELVHEDSGFDFGSAGMAPVQTLESSSFPYLPLVAERLENSHLVCQGVLDGVELYGFSRCNGGWAWASPGPGYSCMDGGSPEGVYVLLPSQPACLSVESAALQAGPLDAQQLGAPTWCGGSSIEVPLEGLIVEPSTGLAWMSDSCMAWR